MLNVVDHVAVFCLMLHVPILHPRYSLNLSNKWLYIERFSFNLIVSFQKLSKKTNGSFNSEHMFRTVL